MTTLEVEHNGKRLHIEVCEAWDFVRDIHSFQANVVDKYAMQRHIIGKFKNQEIAVEKAREWINQNMSQ